jgi:hypothetical protein
MERIPFDIIINHIIPYTYNIQSNILLEDIKNYYTIKNILMDEKHEILALFYDSKPKLYTILYRHFQMKIKPQDYNIIYKFSKNTIFNILFGLFTKEERLYFLEYMLQDNGIWIKKKLK